jgi:hypothetical protein
MEFPMVDRHWLGDLSFAVLLALPMMGLASYQPVNHHRIVAPPAVSMTAAAHSPEGRISLLG